MKSQLIFWAVLTLFAQRALAADVCPESFRSYQEILACAESRSPELQREILAVDVAKGQVGMAGQWKNPDLSVESFHGNSSETSSETDISLGIPWEWGRLSARQSVASGALAQAEAKLFETQLKVRGEIFLKLHRMRQLHHEKEIIDEAISMFGRLVSQYAQRPKLSAEQEISVAVFRMSKSEYELKRLGITEEEAALESFFTASLGEKLQISEKILPPSPSKWPAVERAAAPSSPGMRILDAELEISQAELSLAQSESWPALTLGPSVKFQREGGRSDQLYGFNLSFSLPAFHRNGAGRSTARSGVRLAEVKRNLARVQEDLDRRDLIRSYEESVRVLGSTLSHQSMESKHTQIDRLFLRGVVPSSLVIESHRTFLDLERSRNERELKALSAIQSLSFLQGQKLEFPQ